MNVLHITPSFYPAHVYGGPIQSVYHLCRQLARDGCAIRVLTTNANGHTAVLDVDTNRELEVVEGVHVRYCSRLRPESTSVALLRALHGYVNWSDIVHLTAVYNFPTIPTLVACQLLNKPIIWSPRGALQRWEGSTRLKSKALWERICRLIAPAGMVLHVTSAEEAQESLQKVPGFKAVVIPNAVEIPEDPRRYPGTGTLRLLFLGRLHPKKGIENLLEACKKLNLPLSTQSLHGSNANIRTTWSLVIAGAGDPVYVQTLQERVRKLGLSDQVTMVGEVIGKAKEEAFGHADMLVAPSYTENFGMVVAEALAHGLPVVAGKRMPWKEMVNIGCGMSVDNDPDTLAASIEKMSQLPLEAMGLKGRQWMERDYSWESAARKMIEVYKESVDSHGTRKWHTVSSASGKLQQADLSDQSKEPDREGVGSRLRAAAAPDENQ